MKDVILGGETYQQIETPFEIGDERFNVFKRAFLQISEDMGQPAFQTLYDKLKAHLNAGNQFDAVIELDNFKKSIELKSLNYDAFTYCFSLITLQQGELQKDFDNNYQEKKIK